MAWHCAEPAQRSAKKRSQEAEEDSAARREPAPSLRPPHGAPPKYKLHRSAGDDSRGDGLVRELVE